MHAVFALPPERARCALSTPCSSEHKTPSTCSEKCELSCARSPLDPQHVAAAQNQYEKVAKLLAGGEDPNTQLPTGMTPLHSAVSEGYKDVVGLLLAHNASVDAIGPHGVTPLHLAAHRGRASVAELLLGEGAAVDALAGIPS